MRGRGKTMHYPQARPLSTPRVGLATGALVMAVLVAACGTPPRAMTVVDPPVTGVVTMLEDEVRALPGQRIAWATYWTLCWDAYPGARAYELQALTGEGAAPLLRRQRERCWRLEAAAGENAQAQGLHNREFLLALQAGQLAYRVRAILAGDRVSAWSVPLAVGVATAPQAQR